MIEDSSFLTYPPLLTLAGALLLAILGFACLLPGRWPDRARLRALGAGSLAAAVGLVLPLAPVLPPAPAMSAIAGALLLVALALWWPAARAWGGTEESAGILPAVATAVVFAALAAAGTVTDGTAAALLAGAAAVQLLAAGLRLATTPGVAMLRNVALGAAVLHGAVALATLADALPWAASILFALMATTQGAGSAVALLASSGGLDRLDQHVCLRTEEPTPATIVLPSRLAPDVERTLEGIPGAVFRAAFHPREPLRTVFYGPTIEHLTGWGAADLARANALLDRVALAERDALLRAMETATRRGGASLRHRLQRADGSWLAVRTSFRLLQRLPSGGADLAGYLEDDTADRRALERTLTAARLAQAGSLAADLLPEVRKILTASADANGTPALSSETFRSVLADLDRLAALAAPTTADQSEADLRRSLDDALALLRPRFNRAGVSVVVEIEEGLPRVPMTAAELTRLLVALLTNAVQAIERSGREERRIQVSAWRDTASGRVHASVADTGGGIPSALLERVFDPFVSTLPSAENLGFGLTLARSIAEQSGMTLVVRNEVDGAVARLSFPAEPSRSGDKARQSGADRPVADVARLAG